MLKNILYMSGSIIIFFIGVVVYGIIINLREVTLSEAFAEKGIGELGEITLVINKKNYRIELFSDAVFLKSYKAVFGMNNQSVKTSVNDNVTPVGKYYVCDLDSNYEYYKLVKLSYPNERDASEAYKNGYINESELKLIYNSIKKGECPPADTPLGANIGIHGIGKFNFIFKNLPFIFNWTNGSIAVSNENIDELISVVKIGTKVVIVN